MRAIPYLLLGVVLAGPLAARADENVPPDEQPKEPGEPTNPKSAHMEFYGFAMTDTGFNFGTIDPDWFDVVRPTKLPAFRGEFGEGRRVFFGVRQSRFGVTAGMP